VALTKYGVVICPKCGNAKGVESAKKTTACQCGREIRLDRVKLMFMTDSPLELSDSVAAANAAIRGGGRLPSERRSRKRDPFAAIAERAKAVKDPLERAHIVARGLTELTSEFGLEDLKRVSSMLGKASAEDLLVMLKEHNLVYETAEGNYRAV
jgi:hypothetical protein